MNFIASRNGFYSANGQQFFLGGLQDYQLKLPKDGPVNWTTHEDLAEGMVKILQDEQFKERYPQLTASRTLTMEDIAKEYKQDGIERVIISNDEYKETLGFIPNLSEEMKQMFVDIFEASVDGDFDKSSSLLEDLLGRKPQDIVEILNNK